MSQSSPPRSLTGTALPGWFPRRWPRRQHARCARSGLGSDRDSPVVRRATWRETGTLSCRTAHEVPKRPAPFLVLSIRNWRPVMSVRCPITPPNASISRTKCPLAKPPMAGLQDICPIVSKLVVARRVDTPSVLPPSRPRRLRGRHRSRSHHTVLEIQTREKRSPHNQPSRPPLNPVALEALPPPPDSSRVPWLGGSHATTHLDIPPIAALARCGLRTALHPTST
jgi:hypothetical protein